MRIRFFIGKTCHRTHETLAVVTYLARRHLHYHHQPIALRKSCSKALLQTFGILSVNRQFVDDNLNIVVLIAFKHHTAGHFAHLAINAHIEIALAHHLLKEFLVMSLTCLDKRGEHINTLAVIVTEQEFKNLLLGILHHFLTREIRVCIGGTREQKTQIIIDFGRRTHG